MIYDQVDKLDKLQKIFVLCCNIVETQQAPSMSWAEYCRASTFELSPLVPRTVDPDFANSQFPFVSVQKRVDLVEELSRSARVARVQGHVISVN